MIHAHIDTVGHRQIVGFEIGTRVQFDRRHGGDELWVFLDSYRLKYRANFADFLRRPTHYRIDIHGDIYLTTDSPIVTTPESDPDNVPGYNSLLGRDGRHLKNALDEFILGYDPDYVPPPDGYVYILDEDFFFLKDEDGYFLLELAGDPGQSFVILTDSDGDYLTEDDPQDILIDE